MRTQGNRTIKVKKSDLIERINANKEAHVKEFEAAKIAYKAEALRQLEEARKKIETGELGVTLNLVTPSNVAGQYDKKAEMFEWEIEDEVELSQDEFKDYVQGDFDFAHNARMMNMYYLG